MKRLVAISIFAALFAGAAAVANAQSDKKDRVHRASGTVTKLDRERGKVTIKHGPVSSLNWPSMTMAFDVKDKTLLGKAKQGEKIEFGFVQSGRDNIITEIK